MKLTSIIILAVSLLAGAMITFLTGSIISPVQDSCSLCGASYGVPLGWLTVGGHPLSNFYSPVVIIFFLDTVLWFIIIIVILFLARWAITKSNKKVRR